MKFVKSLEMRAERITTRYGFEHPRTVRAWKFYDKISKIFS